MRTPVWPHYKHADEESKGWRDGPHLLVRSHYTLPTMSSPEGPSGNDPSQSVRAIARRAARRALAQAPVGQTPAGSASTERVSLPGAVALESMGQPGAASQGSAPGESAERELVGEGLVRAAAEGSEGAEAEGTAGGETRPIKRPKPRSTALVNRRVRIWWGGDRQWFAGVVTSYSSRRGHQVVLQWR